MLILGALASHCDSEAEERALALSGRLPGGRVQSALYVEMPFLTSVVMELRVPEVRRLPQCICRVCTTHYCLAFCE